MSDNAVKIGAIASLPRLGWNANWGCIQDALSPFGIPISRFEGVFWDQCMQRAFNDAVANDLDWILTIDYDSMFTQAHVDKLLGTFADNPNMDALAAMQIKRQSDSPLMYKRGADEIKFDMNKPVRVDTAHFGLTLIRVNALRTLPKPWFWSKPGPSGEWDDDRIDSDIWFWNQWYDAGLSVYIQPQVRIGHLEVLVSEYSDAFQFQRTHPGDWRKREYGAGNQGLQLRSKPLPEGPAAVA